MLPFNRYILLVKISFRPGIVLSRLFVTKLQPEAVVCVR